MTLSAEQDAGITACRAVAQGGTGEGGECCCRDASLPMARPANKAATGRVTHALNVRLPGRGVPAAGTVSPVAA